MKKTFILFLSIFLITGCGSKTNTDISKQQKNNNQNINDIGESSDEIGDNLKDPILEWCQLYNPNGFDTLTCVVSNPNDVDIDITYDMVFYKDGKEVSREVDWANFQISPDHNDVIWANVNVPKAEDVDEVKMENIRTSKAYNQSIKAEVKYIETIENQDYFSVVNEKQPTLNNIWFFLYKDINENNKCDEGELVITEIYSTLEKESKTSVYNDVVGSVYGIDYNKYEIYYNAY